MHILERFERWLHPYRFAFEEEDLKEVVVKNKRKKQKFKGTIKGSMSKAQLANKYDVLSRGDIGIDLVTVQKAMNDTQALKLLDRSGFNIGYFHHDTNKHQLACKFDKNSAWLYHERNESKRKRLKPLVYHADSKHQDKTHMIPIGFHGSENDERLLVGFSSAINKGDLKNFEKYIININASEPVLWYISIEKQTDNTAIWKAIVWDENHNIIAKESFHDKNKFVWI